MSRRIIGLDVGTYSIKLVQVEGKARSLQSAPLYYAEKELQLSPEQLFDPEALLNKQKEVLDFLQKEGAFNGDVIITGLPGNWAQSCTLEVPFKDTKKIEAILPGELETQIPIDIESLWIAWYKEQNRTAKEGRVVVGFAKKDLFTAFLRMLQEVGADPRYVGLKPFSLFNLCQQFIHSKKKEQTPEEPAGGIQSYSMAVDIGHTSTSICVFDANHVVMTRSILRGGYNVTKAFSEKLDMPFDKAEAFKHHEAFLELPSEKAKVLEQHLASETAKELYLALAREIRQTMFAIFHESKIRVEKLYLLGGGSRIRNLPEFLRQQLGITVIHPRNIGISSQDADPIQGATAMGYAIEGLRPRAKEGQLNFRKGEFVYKAKLGGKRGSFNRLVMNISAIFVLLCLWGTVQSVVLSKQLAIAQEKEEKACEQMIGKKVTGDFCLVAMKKKIAEAASHKIPDKDTANYYIELAQLLPRTLSLKANLLEMTETRGELRGNTDTHADVDQIVAALSKGKCFRQVAKGETNSTGEGVSFQITWSINCSAPVSSTSVKKG